MRILAIRLARFGDLVLLLPALSLLKARLQNSHLTLLTDTRWSDLAAMCPAIDEVLAIDRMRIRDESYIQALKDIFRFSSDLRRKQFDAAIDFHGFRETNLLAWWSRAPKRLALKRSDQSSLAFCFNLPPVLEDKGLHVSEMFLKVVERFAPNDGRAQNRLPAMVIPSESVAWLRDTVPQTPYAVLYTDAPVKERMWPVERYVALSRHFLDRQVGVVVITGTPRALPEFPEGVRVLSGLSIPRLAAIIASARILVSNDTGPMHLGPVLGIPTLGIFSVGFPIHFRPTGAADAYVQGNPIETVQLNEVIEAAERVWTASAR